MAAQTAAEPLLPIDIRDGATPRTVMNRARRTCLWTAPLILLIAAFLIYDPLSSSGTSRNFENEIVTLTVHETNGGRKIPATLFGIFFEEINHAGAGGLWAELISNRGFEAGGQSTPSSIDPWYPKGGDDDVILTTERTSLFERNRIALRIITRCGGDRMCPEGGVGVVNPGYWGIDVRTGRKYTITFWLRSDKSVKLLVRFISEDETKVLAEETLTVDEAKSKVWQKYTFTLNATSSDHRGKLALTTSVEGSIWLDQVSAFPEETYKGHGFRTELAQMLEELKPAFIRFPGGCYVEGERLENAWRWRETVGPWQERPGHQGDVWNYWSDDGLGYFEFLQLAEDLNAAPVWVFNNGISHRYSVNPRFLQPWVEDVLHGIEFAKGLANTTWGAVRAAMGHPNPFELNHVAIGNEDCWKPWYRENYMVFYDAIKAAYPEIKLISNCDATNGPLNHPADLYDFHVYTNANNLYLMTHQFDQTSRVGPKVFVSEYAVTGSDAGTGSLLAALAEGAFMIGLEINSDVVEMASYAPLFVHEKDRRWNPDAIVFNSGQQYGTPSYWVQQLFTHSSGATLLPFTVSVKDGGPTPVVSVLRRHDRQKNAYFLVIKAVNFGADVISMRIVVNGQHTDSSLFLNSTMATLTSERTWDENSFAQPQKIVPQISNLPNMGPSSELTVTLPAHSIIALDLWLSRNIDQS